MLQYIHTDDGNTHSLGGGGGSGLSVSDPTYQTETLHVKPDISVMYRAQAPAPISLTRIYNVSADPLRLPPSLHNPRSWRMLSTSAVNQCQPLNQLCPVRKASCTWLSTLCSESHIWSGTLITACRAKLKWFFFSFYLLRAPLSSAVASAPAQLNLRTGVPTGHLHYFQEFTVWT